MEVREESCENTTLIWTRRLNPSSGPKKCRKNATATSMPAGRSSVNTAWRVEDYYAFSFR